MVITYKTDEAGYILGYKQVAEGTDGAVEVSDEVAGRIIPGVSKLDNGTLLYKCSVDLDTDGYVLGAGTDPSGTVDLPADEVASLTPVVCKLVDGHLVADATKQSHVQAESEAADTPEPDYKAMYEDLNAKLEQAQSAIMELADLSLGGDSSATSAS
jgi:hypothetical protein